jgi:hypothetical protein
VAKSKDILHRGAAQAAVVPPTPQPQKNDSRPRPASVELIPFDEALRRADGSKKRHLLLGNGFSIALCPKIFTYNTLLQRARESGKLTSQLEAAFARLRTTDFETVMEVLESGAQVVSLYEPSEMVSTLAQQLQADAALLRDALAETIAENHPARPHDIAQEQYASCRRFLAHFGGRIYTLNYDLLLYWTLMQAELGPKIKSDDGFRHPEDWENPCVTWDVQKTKGQRIFYLHGALHIYDAGSELLKFTWSKTVIPLVEQIKKSLEERVYPLIVTEGTSDQKLDRIQHSGFLNRAYRSFSEISGSLFIYGHSLAANDEHLLKLIDKGKLNKVFVGIYGDPELDSNRKIIERARLFRDRRPFESSVEVHFFDASSAHVWDGQESEVDLPQHSREACPAV